MKNLTIEISEAEARLLGIEKSIYSLNELLLLLSRKVQEESPEILKEPLEKYGTAGRTKGNFDFMIRKRRLTSWIGRIENDVLLGKLEKLVSEYELAEGKASEIIKKKKKDITVEEMIHQQEYVGIDRELIDKLTEEMGIREPLNDLLKSV